MTLKPLKFLFLCLFFFLFAGIGEAEAQLFKKLKKRAENTATRKLEKKTEDVTEEVMDTLLGNGQKEPPRSETTKPKGDPEPQIDRPEKEDKIPEKEETPVAESPEAITEKESVKIYSKSDWVAGEQLILYDDFSDDPVGDFPQLWNTDANGSLITLSEEEGAQKWLRLYNRGTYEPDLPKNLPKEFTIEFDVKTYNVTSENTSQTAKLMITLGDGKKAMKNGAAYVQTTISPFQKWPKKQSFKSWTSTEGERLNSTQEKDIRQALADGAHISISVNGKRYRFYVDGKKIFDFPRAIPEGEPLNSILFYCYGIGDDEQNILISNLRVAEGLPEPREKLFKTGKYVTNAILFDVNSATIKPESYGVLRQIAEAMKSEADKNIQIVGHTDSDGTENYNLELSKRRAASVRDALVNTYGISKDRLSTDGKGESEPVAYNTTSLEKAKNRRTEFIVQ